MVSAAGGGGGRCQGRNPGRVRTEAVRKKKKQPTGSGTDTDGMWEGLPCQSRDPSVLDQMLAGV